MPTFDLFFKIYGDKNTFIKNHKYFSSFQKLDKASEKKRNICDF